MGTLLAGKMVEVWGLSRPATKTFFDKNHP